MTTRFNTLLLVLSILFIFSCGTKKTLQSNDNNTVTFTFLQINDVYEIAPLEGGKLGGMARIATLKKELITKNPNTLLIHAGDFLNPSVIGVMKYEGKRIKGKQMVEVMNATKVDLVTFGNHEFDLDEDELQERINESNFNWTSGNVLHVTPKGNLPFEKVLGDGTAEYIPETYTWKITDKNGQVLKIGIFAVTLPNNKKPYVKYVDVMETAKRLYAQLKETHDVVFALTHLEMEDDIKLAKALPGIPLIMGGHDHDNIYQQEGPTKIAKADANAKSAYIHHISFNRKTKKTKVLSRLVKVNEGVKQDPMVAKDVNKWMDIANSSFKESGFDPNGIVANLSTPLDGRESTMRNGPTNLGKILAECFYKYSKTNPDAAFMNSGSVRVDDQLSGEITQFDIIRTLPFGGKIYEVEMTGALLKQILDVGLSNKGTGGYLQLHKIKYNPNLAQKWEIAGQALQEDKNYTIAFNDFLLTGLEAGMDFLTPENKGIIKITKPNSDDKSDLRNDIRLALIDFLKNLD